MTDYMRYSCWLIGVLVFTEVQASPWPPHPVVLSKQESVAEQLAATQAAKIPISTASDATVAERPVSDQLPLFTPLTQLLANNVPSSALQSLNQCSEDELALLQASRYRLKEDQLVTVGQRFKDTVNQEKVMFNWQQALTQQVKNGEITGLTELAQVPVFNHPLYLEMEKRMQQTDWAADDFKYYQQKLQQKTPNPQRYELLQAIVLARGKLFFDVNLAVLVRKQLLMTVAKVANNWTIDEVIINQMLGEYQKKQLDALMPEQVNRFMYAYRFTSTEQLQDYLLLLESNGYQAALSAWRHALDMSFLDGSTK